MAATQTLFAKQTSSSLPNVRTGIRALFAITVLTGAAVLILGYHPFAEDGGIYLPGVLKLLDPRLYPTWNGFVTAQSRFSLFAPILAGIVRITHVDIAICALVIYVAMIWATLFGAWRITSLCCTSTEARYGGLAIFALCLSSPVAGTSLMLIDPYLTARSVSTPCSLLAIAGMLEILSEFKRTGRFRKSSVTLCAMSLLIAAIIHPLMAAYATCSVILLACSSITSGRFRNLAFMAASVFSIATAATLSSLAVPQGAGYRPIALTRHYWFLTAWHWYEIFGLIAPLVLLFAILKGNKDFNERARWLAEMAASGGLIALVISFLFAHQSSRSYFIAMLQPLRFFLIVYSVMFLFLGASLAHSFLKRRPMAWAVLMIALGSFLLFVQVRTFSSSSHLEFPWMSPQNDWERGFLWIRMNTPVDATFALDRDYINSAHEDAQNFRAIAQRSSLPDYDKDGGIAAIEPGLTSEWTVGEAIQANLGTISDRDRKSRLLPQRIHWLVLPKNSLTGFPCLYQNNAMKVCRIPGGN